MRLLRATLIGLATVIFSAPICAAPDALEAAAEMRRLESQLNGSDNALLRGTLPAQWEISAPDGNYTISSRPLRDLLASLAADNRDENLQLAKSWLDHLASHLERSAAAPPATAKARDDLTRILARPEFAGVKPPSEWGLLQERIRGWIIRFLERIFGFVQQHPTESEFFFWTLMGAAVLALGFWLFRVWNREERVSLNLPGAVPRRSPDEWIVAARAAAAQGDLRKAIQCAYWAAIVRLEENGALPRGQTHTPREYLRLVSTARGGVASPFEKPLAALTGSLERFWYAGLTANADDFSACLAALEAFGCRVD